MPPFRDYEKDKADIKRFMTDFYVDKPGMDTQPGKEFKYSKQLVSSLYIITFVKCLIGISYYYTILRER